jgi:alpha-L-fucosidase
MQQDCPGYLKQRAGDWRKDPRAANLAWFKDAGFGLFIHFSPASQVGEGGWFEADKTWGEWQCKKALLKPEDYSKYLLDKFEPQLMDPKAQKLTDEFTGQQFDADQIADLAVAAGMKYITFTSQHVLGRMFMFDTKTSPLCSTKLSPKRDFVAELAKACEKRHLGLFLYVMPPYSEPVVQDRIRTMLTELLTQYGSIAGIWFDGIMEAYLRRSAFHVADVSNTYALVRKLQPHCLISFKMGYTGEEDFLAPEWQQVTHDKDGLPDFDSPLKTLWRDTLRHKPVEKCSTLLEGDQWFYFDRARRKTADQVMEQYRLVRNLKCNFLLDVAPRGDGSIHPEDDKVLREVGRRLSQVNRPLDQ